MKQYKRQRIRAFCLYISFWACCLLSIWLGSWMIFAAVAFCYLFFELLFHFFITKLNHKFQWLIISKDKRPYFSTELLDKFFAESFDSELGWCRKPNTSKQEKGKYGVTKYHINEKGQRENSKHEQLPMLISTYGDSFTFCRQVNDNESFQWYLSELTQTNVLNYGVGNYGLDQAFLRLQREYPKNKTPIVILGCVPSTIVRILSMWKHYSEFGNTLAFKPRYILKNQELQLMPNFINSRDKFNQYQDYISEINQFDDFYHTKFCQEMLAFPYLFHLLKKPHRHFSLISRVVGGYTKNRFESAIEIIMENNLKDRKELFESERSVNLIIALIKSYKVYAQQQGFTPLFLWTPQKDDILRVRSGDHYYKAFTDKLNQIIDVIDMTSNLVQVSPLDDYYSDDSHYGGHLSQKGNQLVAEYIFQQLNELDLKIPRNSFVTKSYQSEYS